MSTNNQQRNDQRLDSLEASMKRVETQVGQIAESMHQHIKGKLPSQPEQAKVVSTLRNGKVINKTIEFENTNDLLERAGKSKHRC